MTTANPLDYSGRQTAPRPPFVRLSLMMLFQYAVWGIWLPILGNFLGTPPSAGGPGFSDDQKGWILGVAASLGAITSPFAGQVADRLMNAERALGLLLIIGGIVQAALTWQTNFTVWIIGLTAYSIVYMPTLALTNSVAFANLPDREKQFPAVRTFGTIGWIIGSVGFSLAFLQSSIGPIAKWPFLAGVDRIDAGAQMKYAMLVAGIISIGYGIFALLALPATPPNRQNARPLAFAAAFKLLSTPSCLALLAAALLVSMIHQVYFIRMGDFIESIWKSKTAIAPTMAIGQVSEIFFLAILGLFIKRIGFKWIIVLGALAYAVRYGLFAAFPTTGMVQAALLLHGACYGFFFAGAFLFVEKISPPDIRHSTQTAFGIIILGAGPILASSYNSLLGKLSIRNIASSSLGVTIQTTDFAKLWWLQAGVAVISMVILLVGFSDRAARSTFDPDRDVDKVAP